MDDNKIIDMYFERNEDAINETDIKYGKLLRHISFNILNSPEYSEECVNDTYMRAWRAMPPKRPTLLRAFLAKIARNLSINKYISLRSTQKMLMTETVFEEIAECIPDTNGSITDDLALKEAINSFLESLGESQRQIFVKRYFYMLPVKEIAVDMKMTVSSIKVNLMRTREKFKVFLEKEGITL